MSFRELTEKTASGFETAVRERKLSAISGAYENVDFRWLCSRYVLQDPHEDGETLQACNLRPFTRIGYSLLVPYVDSVSQ